MLLNDIMSSFIAGMAGGAVLGSIIGSEFMIIGAALGAICNTIISLRIKNQT